MRLVVPDCFSSLSKSGHTVIIRKLSLRYIWSGGGQKVEPCNLFHRLHYFLWTCFDNLPPKNHLIQNCVQLHQLLSWAEEERDVSRRNARLVEWIFGTFSLCPQNSFHQPCISRHTCQRIIHFGHCRMRGTRKNQYHIRHRSRATGSELRSQSLA